jgi:hypothetical protein
MHIKNIQKCHLSKNVLEKLAPTGNISPLLQPLLTAQNSKNLNVFKKLST